MQPSWEFVIVGEGSALTDDILAVYASAGGIKRAKKRSFVL
jgi:hypothetical protein